MTIHRESAIIATNRDGNRFLIAARSDSIQGVRRQLPCGGGDTSFPRSTRSRLFLILRRARSLLRTYTVRKAGPMRYSRMMLLLAVTLVGSAVPATGQEDAVAFNFQIRPLLSDRCFRCHGPDAEHREAGLRLDQQDAATGPVADAPDRRIIVPGDPDQSELWSRIMSDDPDLQMPPPDSGRSLSAAEKQLLRRWIEQGAAWQGHWSLEPIQTVSVPDTAPAEPGGNEIDRFIQQRLNKAGLPPAPIASKATLLRRLSFDLTGLPPTLEELDTFLADESDDAWETQVDRLLQSPHLGERLASEWLDIARYSDTYGYQVDRDRDVWPWRDWVINAFNANLPYDEFLTQQVAGDLLPDATSDQILATTFNRLHPQKVEGGSTPEEFRVEYVADRTQTVGTAFLGLTFECCRCHDHKYDPISQREYYQMFSFFDNIDEAGLYSYFTPSVPTPTLLLADDATKQKQQDIEQQIAAAESVRQELRDKQQPAFAEWLQTAAATPADKLIPDQQLALDFEAAPGAPNRQIDGPIGKAIELTGDDAVGTQVGNFRRFDPFSISLWVRPATHMERAVIFHRSRAWTDAGSRGYELLLEDGRLSAALIHFYPGNALRVQAKEPLALQQWQHVCVTYDGSSRADGLRLYVDGQPAAAEIVRDNLYKNITGGGGDNITIGERFRDRGFTNGGVDEFQVYGRELVAAEVAQLADGSTLQGLLQTPTAELSAVQRELLFDYYLSNVNEAYRSQLTVLKTLREERSKAYDSVREIMVMQEMQQPRQTYLLRRGAYDQPGDPVESQTPAALPALTGDLPHNRLGLARWMTDPQHPLTARVAVNRFWQQMFGYGLVRTPEDFGSQGQLPSHPQLLDWLARDFIEHGWDVRRLLRQMVTSVTYRRSSRVSPELRQRDPENRLLARMNAYRMNAEMLRDNALAASGLLVRQIGGPPARPYDLEVSFKPIKPDTGDGLYRRSVYTFWKRTAPAPMMMTLDASKRDVCQPRRERTSSPLQAFVMLNGPQFVEAGRVLAEQLLLLHGDDDDRILRTMFRSLTSRQPDNRELTVLQALQQRQLEDFTAAPDRAASLLKVGSREPAADLPAPRVAAFAVVASTLLNYDECAIRR